MSATTPKVNSKAQQELKKAGEQLDQFEKEVKDMTLDRMNEQAKPADQEPQTKLSDREIENSNQIRLKPVKRVSSREKFNEAFRKEFEFMSEYVQFIAENFELIGSTIEAWTKKFPGQDCEYWEVPTNKPVWGPRYLAENLRNCNYHVFSMHESVGNMGSDGIASYTGRMVVDTVKQRLNANPVNTNTKSIFMGASGF